MCVNPLYRLNPKKTPHRVFLAMLKGKWNKQRSITFESFNTFKSRYISDSAFLTQLGIRTAERFGLGEYVLQLPCRKCIECCEEESRQWTARCQLESRYHDSCLFVTLTYDDEHVPITPEGFQTLRYYDFQLFMKRLRKKYRKPLRYRVCSEYGETTRRPHYHVLFFGLNLHDLQFLYSLVHGRKVYSSNRGGQFHYNSSWLREVWQNGNVDVAAVEYGSIKYVNNYMNKFELQGIDEFEALEQIKRYYPHQAACYKAAVKLGIINKPKHNQSTRPAIGRCAYKDLEASIMSTDSLPSGLGLRVKHVKYLDKIFFELHPLYKDGVLKHRASLAKAVDYDNHLSPEEKRKRREERLLAKLKFRSRPL